MINTNVGRDVFRMLKEAAGAPGPALCIPVGLPPRALLRPVATRAGVLQREDVKNLTDWRNRFVAAFLTEFQATTARTERWLTDVVGPNDRKILFMADSPDGTTFGYMGLDFIDWTALSGEADAVVRGRDAPRGVMTQALRTLLGWARGQLGLRELTVRVRSDNSAVEFYRKAGFSEFRRVALRQVLDGDRVCLVEDSSGPPGEPSLVHMRYEA